MLDISRANKEFGFDARTGFDKGLRETVKWYQSYQMAGFPKNNSF
jgi:nucleoside-diphosphate-sugar epimerase